MGKSKRPRRPHVSLTTKLAAALAELQYLRGDPFAWPTLKAMTDAQLCSLYQWDHAVYHAWDGSKPHFTNLTPRLILAHREKTAKRDIPTIAKARRAEKKRQQEAHRVQMARLRALAYGAIDVRGDMADGPALEHQRGQVAAPKARKWPSRKIPSRPFPKGHRPMRKGRPT
jgi:hypothetical protein